MLTVHRAFRGFTMRTCVICGKDISDMHGNRQVCSETCRKIRHNEQQRDYFKRDHADRATFFPMEINDYVIRCNFSRRQGA